VVADGRETRELGTSIAQRSRRSQRGEDYWGEASATPWLMGGKCANWGQASHRGHGGHRGGALWGRGFGDPMADKRETRELGKASHGGHRGGGLWVRGFGDAEAYWGETREQGKCRRESRRSKRGDRRQGLPIPPSVTSVASVRCSLWFARFSSSADGAIGSGFIPTDCRPRSSGRLTNFPPL
jgi:hypothetical protein